MFLFLLAVSPVSLFLHSACGFDFLSDGSSGPGTILEALRSDPAQAAAPGVVGPGLKLPSRPLEPRAPPSRYALFRSPDAVSDSLEYVLPIWIALPCLLLRLLS